MACSSAFTGLSTALFATFSSTSPTAPGGAAFACGAAIRVSVLGHNMLAATPTTAAASVPITYSARIGRMPVASPGTWLLMAAMTSTSTSTGATAFSAEMNKVPRKAT